MVGLRPGTPSLLTLVAPLLLLGALGCSGPGADEASDPVATSPSTSSSVPVLTISDAPSFEIGDMVGDGGQALAFVEDVLPLENGELAILDSGADQVLIFDSSGERVRTMGREGDGPGEFRDPARMMLEGDSLFIFDEGDRSISTLTLDGAYQGEVRGSELAGDDSPELHVLYHGRYMLDGVLKGDSRARAKRVADQIPFPLDRPGVRYARVAQNGGLWIREPQAPTDEAGRWIVVSESGEPTALVELPLSFDPLWLGENEVIGRWVGDYDVNFVRSYPLTPSGRTAALPEWIDSRATIETPTGETRDSLVTELKKAAKNAAVAQEMHYADHYTYTMDLPAAFEAGEFELPAGVEVEVLSANGTGHSMLISMAGLDAFCGLIYGDARIGGGLIPGAITCSR